jgi:hypothetical protein
MTIANTVPFQPSGNTIRIAGDPTTPPTPVVVPEFPGAVAQTAQGDLNFRIRNTSLTADVCVGYGATSAEATANAVLPVAAGSGSKSLSMGPGQTEVYTLPAGSFFTVRSVGVAVNVDITPGEGV